MLCELHDEPPSGDGWLHETKYDGYRIEAAVSGMREPKRLWIVDNATHLFPGQLDPFEHAAEEAVAYLRAFS